MKRNDRCPNPPDMCRITFRSSLQGTLVTWTPTYDGTGRVTNGDPNVRVHEYTCEVCGMEWQETVGGPATPTQPLPKETQEDDNR